MDLEVENQKLKEKLDLLMHQAKENSDKARRFQSLELRLISSSTIRELVYAVLVDYKKAFHLDAVTLVLDDPDFEIQRMLGNGIQDRNYLNQVIYLHDAEQSKALSQMSLFPRLGPYNRRQHQWLFPTTSKLNSVAILPLVGHGRRIGSLNLGSMTKERFVQPLGADFLERLAAIASICFENTINYERLKLLGLTDPLTGVHNRRFFDQRLKEEVIRALRSRQDLSCLFFDIDFFKRINDQHGHKVGDMALRNVAQLIASQMRGSDVLSRYGGEEFSALLSQTKAQEACDIAERIRSQVETSVLKFEGKKIQLTLSIGVATLDYFDDLDTIAETMDSILDSADMALLKAKETGRNKVVFAQRTPQFKQQLVY